jgi:hypothetical protein
LDPPRWPVMPVLSAFGRVGDRTNVLSFKN